MIIFFTLRDERFIFIEDGELDTHKKGDFLLSGLSQYFRWVVLTTATTESAFAHLHI